MAQPPTKNSYPGKGSSGRPESSPSNELNYNLNDFEGTNAGAKIFPQNSSFFSLVGNAVRQAYTVDKFSSKSFYFGEVLAVFNRNKTMSTPTTRFLKYVSTADNLTSDVMTVKVRIPGVTDMLEVPEFAPSVDYTQQKRARNKNDLLIDKYPTFIVSGDDVWSHVKPGSIVTVSVNNMDNLFNGGGKGSGIVISVLGQRLPKGTQSPGEGTAKPKPGEVCTDQNNYTANAPAGDPILPPSVPQPIAAHTGEAIVKRNNASNALVIGSELFHDSSGLGQYVESLVTSKGMTPFSQNSPFAVGNRMVLANSSLEEYITNLDRLLVTQKAATVVVQYQNLFAPDVTNRYVTKSQEMAAAWSMLVALEGALMDAYGKSAKKILIGSTLAQNRSYLPGNETVKFLVENYGGTIDDQTGVLRFGDLYFIDPLDFVKTGQSTADLNLKISMAVKKIIADVVESPQSVGSRVGVVRDQGETAVPEGGEPPVSQALAEVFSQIIDDQTGGEETQQEKKDESKLSLMLDNATDSTTKAESIIKYYADVLETTFDDLLLRNPSPKDLGGQPFTQDEMFKLAKAQLPGNKLLDVVYDTSRGLALLSTETGKKVQTVETLKKYKYFVMWWKKGKPPQPLKRVYPFSRTKNEAYFPPWPRDLDDRIRKTIADAIELHNKVLQKSMDIYGHGGASSFLYDPALLKLNKNLPTVGSQVCDTCFGNLGGDYINSKAGKNNKKAIEESLYINADNGKLIPRNLKPTAKSGATYEVGDVLPKLPGGVGTGPDAAMAKDITIPLVHRGNTGLGGYGGDFPFVGANWSRKDSKLGSSYQLRTVNFKEKAVSTKTKTYTKATKVIPSKEYLEIKKSFLQWYNGKVMKIAERAVPAWALVYDELVKLNDPAVNNYLMQGPGDAGMEYQWIVHTRLNTLPAEYGKFTKDQGYYERDEAYRTQSGVPRKRSNSPSIAEKNVNSGRWAGRQGASHVSGLAADIQAGINSMTTRRLHPTLKTRSTKGRLTKADPTWWKEQYGIDVNKIVQQKAPNGENYELMVVNMPSNLVKVMKKYGFGWGGDYNQHGAPKKENKRNVALTDAMHFEFWGDPRVAHELAVRKNVRDLTLSSEEGYSVRSAELKRLKAHAHAVQQMVGYESIDTVSIETEE